MRISDLSSDVCSSDLVRTGALYTDGGAYVTPALTARFDEIARAMPEFYFGRFDVRFRSVEALGRGEDFQILEVNGASAEAIHIWDPEQTVRETYRVLFEQFRLLRSEEHTSELQSLMRISYAVFCLKKKT